MSTYFSKEHEYIIANGKTGTVGITGFAQEQLGDIVFVDLPSVGKTVKKGDEVAVVESVKAASEIYSPVSGTIVEVNDTLGSDPSLVNSDAEGEGWMFKIEISDEGELADLMDADAYQNFVS